MMSTFVGAGMSVSMPKGGVAQLQPQRRITQRAVKITGVSMVEFYLGILHMGRFLHAACGRIDRSVQIRNQPI